MLRHSDSLLSPYYLTFRRKIEWRSARTKRIFVQWFDFWTLIGALWANYSFQIYKPRHQPQLHSAKPRFSQYHLYFLINHWSFFLYALWKFPQSNHVILRFFQGWIKIRDGNLNKVFTTLNSLHHFFNQISCFLLFV